MPVTRTYSVPSPFCDPPNTESPAPLATSRASSVTSASFTCDSPRTTSPSAGTISPASTMTVCPTCTSSSGTSAKEPPGCSTCACAGRSSAISLSASPAPITARISTQWPKSMMTMSVASSQKKSMCMPSACRTERWTKA